MTPRQMHSKITCIQKSVAIIILFMFHKNIPVLAFRLFPSRIQKQQYGGVRSSGNILFRKKFQSTKSIPLSSAISSASPNNDTMNYTILDDESSASVISNASTSTINTKSRMNRDLQNILQTAEKAAFKAGEIMIQTCGKISISKTKASAADLVTESDIECQRVIQEIIQSDFPQDYFLGEEDVEPGSFASSAALENALRASSVRDSNNNKTSNTSSASDVDNNEEDASKILWIVDPIDGTTNFQAGLPMFCVSIGAVLLQPGEEGKEEEPPQVIVGVIYNPILNEMISAVRGRGCYVNGKRLLHQQSSIVNVVNDDICEKMEDGGEKEVEEGGIALNEAMVNVGFPIYSEGTLRASSRAVTALATKVRGLRMIASASQVMSWVAQGKLNAYVSWDLNAWDIAAGMVIVEESGGFISDFNGKPASILTRDMIISCNEGNSKHDLSKAVLQVLTENDCLEY